MRVQSYTALHYGKDYLPYALKSVYEHVEQSHIIYTPSPSHGTRTNSPPIETKIELQQCLANNGLDDKLKWYDIKNAFKEGDHRDVAVRLCEGAGANLILVLDYDEIWNGEMLRQALEHVWQQNNARDWLINFTHLWRSFDWCCRDEGWPVRIIDLRHSDGVEYIPRELGDIYHFGYSVSDKLMKYKWKIHGHKAEMRPDWLNREWLWWPPQENCHPTNDRSEEGIGFWNPVPFDKRELPLLMRQHPFYDAGKIE